MASNASNVVRLSGARHDPAQRIINECRDRLTDELAQWLQGIGSDVAEEIFVLADSTRDRTKQTQYLDLRRKVENEWGELVSACRRAFSEEKAPPEIAMQVPDFDGLQLVDDDELSATIVGREFSARIAETCESELYGLDRRISLVLGDVEAGDVDHPLRPEAICDALTTACNALTSNTENRSMLLRRIERHLHAALPGIYRGINAYLIDLGLLPDLKRTYRRANSEPTAEQSILNAALGAAFPAGAAAAPSGGGDFLGTLQRLINARAGDASAGGIPAFAGALGGHPGITTDGGYVHGPGAGNAGQPFNPVTDAAALSQAFFSSLEQFRHAEGGETVNQIHQIRSSEAARQVGHVEAVTIDIVAMLFDFIFDDKELPDGVKSLVGRLQIPVLKVAMQDSSFFADRHHPARRFLDEISGIAIRWGGSVDTEDPFYCVLADLISRIQDGFESDIEIFSRSLEELQQFVDSQTAVEDKTAHAATLLATQRERETKAWERAQAAVAELANAEHPLIIQDFLTNQWQFVLQKVALDADADSGAWQDSINLISDIADSIVPRKTSDERMSLIRSLPGLLGRINRGLDLVSTDKTERRPFFDALVDLHTAALKGETSQVLAATPPKEEDKAEGASRQIETEFDTNSPAGDLIVTRSLNNGVEIE
ncbi:MAG TPA: DUF1631 family protein, partial [Rhodocyclaceae bacterium]|nr:DUF1631 family protein [Rhodocyclaceae bacterium]